MKKIWKISSLLCICFLLSGCTKQDVDRLEEKVNLLEDKIDLLLQQNNMDSSNVSGNHDDSSANNATDLTVIESTIANYRQEATQLKTDIEQFTISSDRDQMIRTFFEWKAKIETLEEKLDRYEDELEASYHANKLSYSDFRKYDYQLEEVETILDQAENTLEYKTNYDD